MSVTQLRTVYEGLGGGYRTGPLAPPNAWQMSVRALSLARRALYTVRQRARSPNTRRAPSSIARRTLVTPLCPPTPSTPPSNAKKKPTTWPSKDALKAVDREAPHPRL